MSYGGYQQPPPSYGAPPPPQGYGYGTPQMQYAGVGKRIVAHIIDGIIVGLGGIPGWILMIVSIFSMGAAGTTRGPVSDTAAAGAVGLGLLSYFLLFVGIVAVWLYNCYLLGRDGATIGKKIMKIKVLDPQNQPLGFGKAFLRELVKHAVGSFCFILLLWPLWDDQKQGLQDKIFSTHVYDA